MATEPPKVYKNLYIDIDGVILVRGGFPAEHVDIFLNHVLLKYNVFWLTSRCKGSTTYTISYLSRFFDKKTMALLKKIKPTYWQLDKTEAIDFSTPFVWLDHDLFDSEKTFLRKQQAFESWIKMDLAENPNQLRSLTKRL